MLLALIIIVVVLGVVYAYKNAQYVSPWVLIVGGAATFLLGIWPILVVDGYIWFKKQQAIKAELEQKKDEDAK